MMASIDTGQISRGGHRLHIYTDGCYEPRSGTGGWAFVAYRDGLEIAAECGRIERSSNNAMELIALLEAARWINTNALNEQSVLWSDSVYAVNGCNQWRHVWKNWGWRKRRANPNARSRPIADSELWIAIDNALLKNELVDVAWCKGHSGIPGNEKADSLAELGRGMSVGQRDIK